MSGAPPIKELAVDIPKNPAGYLTDHNTKYVQLSIQGKKAYAPSKHITLLGYNWDSVKYFVIYCSYYADYNYIIIFPVKININIEPINSIHINIPNVFQYISFQYSLYMYFDKIIIMYNPSQRVTQFQEAFSFTNTSELVLV